jgi:hypothetical protein
MEAARTSETLVNFYQTTRCYNPEDSNLHTHRRENLKSYIYTLFSSCLMQPGEEFLCHGNGSLDEILSICLAQENREMYP